MTGEQRISATPARIWDALNDPVLLAQVIPGCEQLTRRDEKGIIGFDATVTQKIGPIQARFKGKITLADMKPPESYTLRGEGSGGAAGFAKGEAQIRLEPEGPNTTKLIYTVKANVGGKLAQLGQRLIDQAAKSLADDFFARFSAAIEAPPTLAESAAVEAAASAAETPIPAQAAAAGGLPASIWVPAFVAITLVLVVAFAML
jgi:carbon monoxide dehydrogenase subunit G